MMGADAHRWSGAGFMACNRGRATHSGVSEPDSSIEVKSVYGMQTHRPAVELTVGQTVVQLEAHEDLELGAMLIREAMATKADAFIFDFARTELGVDDLAAALMLRKFHEWRLSREHGSGEGAARTSCDATSAAVADALASSLTSADRATKM